MESLVGDARQRRSSPEGLQVIAYRAMLEVPRVLAQYLGGLLKAERRERGTRRRSRALTCFHQAVFGLRWFRENRDVPALARDHGIPRATGYHYRQHRQSRTHPPPFRTRPPCLKRG